MSNNCKNGYFKSFIIKLSYIDNYYDNINDNNGN